MLNRLIVFLCMLLFFVSLDAKEPFGAVIETINTTIKARMVRGNTWHEGCPVGLGDLRYLRVSYLGFDGKTHRGELIVHRSVAKEVTAIFRELYAIGYPIRKMELVSRYGGSDWRSIEADNTSAFNCRKATGSRHWSRHAYGKAIDINPIENPYIAVSGRIAHRASLRFRQRKRRGNTPAQRAMILQHDAIVTLFKRYGWRWGGLWHGAKDYQHFDKCP